MKTLRHEEGFNLIELMIVVGIVGILCATGIPQYIKYIKRARTSEGTVHARKIFNALNDWQSDPSLGDGRFPTSYNQVGIKGSTFLDVFPSQGQWWQSGDMFYVFSVATTSIGSGDESTTVIVTANAKDGLNSTNVFGSQIVVNIKYGPVITYISGNF